MNFMASPLWYLYIIKEKIKNIIDAKPNKSSYIPPDRYRKVPPILKYPKKCISCEACKESCPAFAIEMYYNNEYKKNLPNIDVDSCISCANCVEACPTGVLEIDKHRLETEGLFFYIPKSHTLMIDGEKCVLCGQCKEVCPIDIIIEKPDTYFIEVSKCISCKECYKTCPVGAIIILDEKTHKEKINRFFELKLKKSFGELDISEKINKIPHISKYICIKCGNCKEICPGEIDLNNYKVVNCLYCGYCLEVCPTGAIRTEVKIEAKNKEETYYINEDQCIGCRICYKVCKVNAIEISKEIKIPYIIPDKCVTCGLCAKKCPVDAITKVKKEVAEKTVKKRIIENKIIEIIENDIKEYTKKYGLVKDYLENILKNKILEELKKYVMEETKKIMGENGDKRKNN